MVALHTMFLSPRPKRVASQLSCDAIKKNNIWTISKLPKKQVWNRWILSKWTPNQRTLLSMSKEWSQYFFKCKIVTVICECVLSLSKTRRFCAAIFFLYFSNYFNLIKLQLKLSTTATLGTSKKVAIVERLKEEWMYTMYRPSAKKKKMARVERWPLRKS